MKDVDARISIKDMLKEDWFVNNRVQVSISLEGEKIKSILRFSMANLLQKEILFYIAKITTDWAGIHKMKDLFLEIDENGDGEINNEEIVNAF